MRITNHSADAVLFAKSCRLSSSLITILAAMRDLLILSVHLVATIVRLMRRGGARAIVAGSLLLKQQLLIVTRPRCRATGSASTGPSGRGSMCRLDGTGAHTSLCDHSETRQDTGFSAIAREA